MRKKHPQVLLALGWYDYRLHQGIEKYAQTNNWHLYADYTREKIIPWGWKGDGILAWLGAGDDLAEFVASVGVPTVDFSFRRPELRFPRVLEDHARAACLVAEYYLTHGFKHFCYYSDSGNWSYEERGNEFSKVLAKKGYSCQWLRWHTSAAYAVGRHEWHRKRRWLAQEMKHAKKPLAVFAANDQQALDVLESCEIADIKVPEEVSIFGAENYLLAPNAMRTPISSVDTNLDTLGYRGAELLGQLLCGKPPPAQPIRIPPMGLIARKSSDLMAIDHPGLQRSLNYLWEHFDKPIGVNDLARVAAMSVSGLHHAFVEHLGRPPGSELCRVRIECAKKLLVESKLKLEEIARKSGYPNANSFWVAFRRSTGTSPKKYQKQFSI